MPDTLEVVAAALVNENNEVLLAQRPQGNMMEGAWEFPGGKVEKGESSEAALVRELHEELGITVAEKDLEAFWFLSHSYPQFHLMMPVWVCRTWEGEPAPLEHDAICWMKPSAMHELEMIEADDTLVEKLRLLLEV